MKKWKYPDPKLVSEKEKWYENVPEDKELENYFYALLNRHHINDISFKSYDAGMVPALLKLFYKWSGKKYKLEKIYPPHS